MEACHNSTSAMSQQLSNRTPLPTLNMNHGGRGWNKRFAAIDLSMVEAQCDPWAGADHDSAHKDQKCVARALANLGVALDVGSTPQGPLRPMRHGNPLLSRFGLHLCPVSTPRGLLGRFLLCSRGHAVAVIVSESGVEVIDGDKRKLISSVDSIGRPDEQKWFQLLSLDSQPIVCTTLTDVQQAAVNNNWVRARQRQALPPVPVFTDRSGLPQTLQARIAVSREEAMRRRSMMLIRPAWPPGWSHPAMLVRPIDIMSWDMDTPTIRQLAYLNAHQRDRHLRFYADDHKYLVDGRATLGSVTGLIHAFSEDFDALTVIQRMMHGQMWPRPGCLCGSK